MICVHVHVTVEMGTIENNEDSVVQHAMIKPVYIKNSEIQLDISNKINDFEMYESLQLKVGDNTHCVQAFIHDTEVSEFTRDADLD